MMLNQPPPDLFPERPVRSDFSQGVSYRTRRFITVSVLLSVLTGALYMGFGRTHTRSNEAVPIIKAEGTYKQRPQEPGGLDIPHQDVDVYKELDGKESAPAQVEHLMPAAEVPHQNEENMGFGDLNPNTDTASRVEKLSPVMSDAGMPVLDADNSGAKPDADSEQNADKVEALNTASVPQTVPQPVSAAKAPQPIKTTVIERPVKAKAPPSTPEKLPPVVASNPVPMAPSVPLAAVPPVPAKNNLISGKAPAVVPTSEVTLDAKKTADTADGADKAVAAAAMTPVKGSISLQIASVQNQATAESTMKQMQSKYSSILGATRLHLVRADLGSKGIYYRIQTEPVPEVQATAMCKSLKNLNAGCLIVR